MGRKTEMTTVGSSEAIPKKEKLNYCKGVFFVQNVDIKLLKYNRF